jgi:thiol-disulfide isomerase/thioredoxin
MKHIMIFILIFLISILFGCSSIPENYDDFPNIHIENWDEVDGIIADGLFLVYYYSPHCPDCKSIEKDVISFIYHNQKTVNIYLMKSMSVDEQGTPPTFLRGVPALLIYQDKEFKEMLLGTRNVVQYLESIDVRNQSK